MLTLLARGESFSHGLDSDGVPITSDNLEAVFSLGQDDIKLLMPESKRLHQFCVEECVSSGIYDDSNLSGKSLIKFLFQKITNPG
jgi:hypothetical protein